MVKKYLFFSCGLLISLLSHAQDSYSPPQFSIIKNEFCEPTNALDWTAGKTLVIFMHVQGYHDGSRSDWGFLKDNMERAMKQFIEDKSMPIDIFYMVFLTELPDELSSLYCDANAAGPKFPSTNTDGKGIYLGKFSYSRLWESGEFDGWSVNAVKKLVDQNGDVVTNAKIFP